MRKKNACAFMIKSRILMSSKNIIKCLFFKMNVKKFSDICKTKKIKELKPDTYLIIYFLFNNNFKQLLV